MLEFNFYFNLVIEWGGEEVKPGGFVCKMKKLGFIKGMGYFENGCLGF